MTYELLWEDRRGAGRMVRGSRDEIERRLRTIRREAIVRCVETDSIVGACEPADRQDDRRIKWLWWIENAD